MERQPVTSSQIRSVGYNPDSNMLEIEFQSGGVYDYYNVPEETYHQLMEAPSKGHYFNEWVRDYYPYEKVSEVAAGR